MTKLCFDYDPLLYSAGSVGETRSIKVVHRASGDEYEFSNRTAFWGHWKKRAGGWLAEYNAAKAEQNRRLPDEFDIIDVQEPEPLSNCIHTLKRQIEAVKETVGAHLYYGYSGRGEVFRVDVSTILKYKGNREGMLRPLHLDAMKEYLEKYQSCRVVEKIEADDACSMDNYAAYQAWKKTKADKDKLVLAGIDKDYKGCDGFFYNINSSETREIDGFGKLWVVEKLNKGKVERTVDGFGRLWLYFQVMSGDDADNYFANSGNPDVKWADMSAYNVLKDAKNDKEAWAGLVQGYKTIYPSPRKIIGWRGYEDPKDRTILKPNHKDFEIEIDWLYMLQENFTLAKMLRWKDDTVDVKQVLTKLGVEH